MKKVIIVLFTIFLLVGCETKKEVVVSNNEENKNVEQQEEVKETEEVKCPTVDELVPYTTDNMAGLYVGEYKCEEVDYKFSLNLYNDGTFLYSEPGEIEGNIGNYLVKNNKLFLNYLMYYTGDKITLYDRVTDTIAINKDKTITISNVEFCGNKNSNITLTKDDTNFSDDGVNEVLKNKSF